MKGLCFFFFPHFFIECVYVFSVVREEEEEERDRGGQGETEKQSLLLGWKCEYD